MQVGNHHSWSIQLSDPQGCPLCHMSIEREILTTGQNDRITEVHTCCWCMEPVYGVCKVVAPLKGYELIACVED